MRVISPDEDNWKKLARMIRYLRGIPEIPLTICADRIEIFKWWVDGYHVLHTNFQLQMGSTQLLVKVLTVSTSTNQTFNTRSSTETELVAADDSMPHEIWTGYFIIIKDTR